VNLVSQIHLNRAELAIKLYDSAMAKACCDYAIAVFGELDSHTRFVPNVLYQNRGDGTFEDVAKEAKVDVEAPGMSATFEDFDNDGHLDIYVVNKGPNVLYQNNGNETFTDITENAGVKAELGSNAAAAGDYDNDGFIDIYVANSGPAGSKKGEPNILYRNNGMVITGYM